MHTSANLRKPVESGPCPTNPGQALEGSPKEPVGGIADADPARPETAVRVSEAFALRYGLPPGQTSVSEEEWLALVHPEDLSRLDTEMRNIRRPDGPFAARLAIHQSDGSERWIFLWADVIPDRGRLIHVAGARLHVTRARQN